MVTTPLSHRDTLVIIEAPAKEKALAKILSKLGFGYDIASTSGHLTGFGKSLFPMAISRDFRPTGLQILKPEVYDRVTQAIGAHEHIIIATDPDSEGHYIANDVADICLEKGKSISRAFLYGMDTAHVSQALNHLLEHDAELAKPAARRRIVDRIISSSLSDLERGLYVGRVMTPTINRVANSVQSTLPIQSSRPFDGVELVYHASAQLHITPSETARAIQSVYVKGRIAYHRSDSHRVTQAASQSVGLSFGKSLPANNHADLGVHPAPYPIGADLDLNMPLDACGLEDAILMVDSRQWTGTPHESGTYKLEHHFMEAMHDLNLGRPSTIPFTADRLASGGLISPDGSLSPKGSAWVNQGSLLLDSAGIQVFNDWIANGGNLDECLESLGMMDVVHNQMATSNTSDCESSLGCNFS